MPNNHPFPFHDGAMWLDNSTLSSWMECPRLYQYTWLEQREALWNKTAMNYGKAIHLAIAALTMSCGTTYTKANPDVLNKLLETHFERYPQPPDDHRQLGLAKETIARYIRTYEVEPWSIMEANGFPLIERLLWTNIGNINGIPLNYYGVIDLVVKKPDGTIWIVDHKTTSMLGKTLDYDMAITGQMRGYAWLFEQCFHIQPTGYIVDAIRSLAPGPTALKTSATLEAWWSEQFRRLPFYLNEEQIEEWYQTVNSHIANMLWHHERSWPMNTKSCVNKYGCCSMYQVCTLPKEQRLVALQSNLFTINDWTERTLGEKLTTRK